MEKLKILQVNKLYYPEIGGIEKTLQQISEGLNEQSDLEVKVLVCQKKGLGKIENINGIEVHRTSSLGVIASVPMSFSFLWEFRNMAKNVDIVQFHMPFPLGDLACILSGYRGRMVAFWHSDVVKQKGWMVLYRPFMNIFLKRVDLVLVGAQGVAVGSKYLSPYLDKCKVVPFAVDNYLLEAGRKYLEQNGYLRRNNTLKLLFIGRLVYYKGCSVLLEAVAHLGGDVTLTIVGNGELEGELKKKCGELNIGKFVTFTGRVSEETIINYFEDADIFVLPSIERSEAFALVQLEAMAYGLPVINTNLASGVPEVSVHMQTGLTVEPNNFVELAKAIKWLCIHKTERVSMGMKARERVEEMYTQKKMVTDLIGIYRKLIENRRNCHDENSV